MKLAVSGKGGVGKTTLVAAMASELSSRGRKVLAIDADPTASLAPTLGMDVDRRIIPISEMHDLIEDRTGARPGVSGGMFRMNPRVDDIPDKYAVSHPEIMGLRLMVMGAVKKGGGGCACPENVLLKALVQHLVLFGNEDLIMDMEAGIEHLGRATAAAVDCLVVVVEPSRRSVETAFRIKELAADIKLSRLAAVANKIRSPQDRRFLERAMDGFPLIGCIPYDNAVSKAEIEGIAPSKLSSALHDEVAGIINQIITWKA